MEVPFRKSTKGITFKVKVYPRSSQKGIAGLSGDALKIKVNSPPVGGAANEEAIEILAEYLGVRKTTVKILKGHASKEKVIEIEGLHSLS